METQILEGQVVRLIKEVAKATTLLNLHLASGSEAVQQFLENAEVALHQEKINELVEFFNTL